MRDYTTIRNHCCKRDKSLIKNFKNLDSDKFKIYQKNINIVMYGAYIFFICGRFSISGEEDNFYFITVFIFLISIDLRKDHTHMVPDFAFCIHRGKV